MKTLRQSAFLEKRPMLKGALHCHTTRSDGSGDPADVLRLHRENGYDFVSITDHRRYNYENFAPETGLTLLPGMEMDRNHTGLFGHCFHAVSIGPSREDGNGFTQDQIFSAGFVSDQREFQPVIDRLRANHNLVIYCHPGWSGTPARAFENLYGYFAMELWNTGCAVENDMDTDNGVIWDELLMQGKHIYGVATDDGHAMYQHCKGWVRVNAENNVPAILKALEAGAFYASCGPEIYDFVIENGRATVECSPCQYIGFCYGRSPYHMQWSADASLTHAEFDVPEGYRYLRIVVKDAQGRRAWSNPIFLHA
ncbi:MAG: hypothetical protein RR482_00510 [Clostridia bacterium]